MSTQPPGIESPPRAESPSYPPETTVRWPRLAFIVVILAILTGMAVGVGALNSGLLIVVLLCLATVPGAALARRVYPDAGLSYLAILGTVIGLGLWAVGGLLSSLSGSFWIRLLPIFVAGALWLWPKRRNAQRSVGRTNRRELPAAGVAGSAVAVVGLLPSLKNVLGSQPAEWTGWHQFYIDLPFQIALTSEVAVRAPETYPWVPDTLISYTWLFHSAMGVWSSLSSVPSAGIVLQVWPILFVALFPLLLSLVAWEVTQSRLVSAAAPLLYVFAQGLVVFSGGALEHNPLFQISPTRDFAHLFILIAVLSMSVLFQRRATDSGHWRWWVLMLTFSSFVAVGAKGSILPILLGGILSAGLVLIITRKVRRSDFIVLACFLVATVGSTILLLPEPGFAAISWGPLTFLPPDTASRPLTSLVFLIMLAVIVVGFLTVTGKASPEGWVIPALLAGVSAAGILGLALFTHPGYSQNYFWQGAQPIFVIAMAWAGATLWQKYGPAAVVSGLLVFLVANVSWALSNRVWLVSLVIVAVAIAAAVGITARRRDGASAVFGRRSATIIAVAAVLVSTAQAVSVPVGVDGGSTSFAESTAGIHSTQLEAYEFIRTHSTPDEMVVTNKHCLAGDMESECEPNWFALAAWSERRVLVEGWGYTQRGPSPGHVQAELDASSGFIESPTPSERQQLLDDGVTLVYVDKREPHSADLGRIASLVYESEWAMVYSLTGDR